MTTNLIKFKIGAVLLEKLSKTWRLYLNGERTKLNPDIQDPSVVAFGHGEMLPIWYLFRGGGFCATVSASSDGTLLSDYLTKRLGYTKVIRGSSSSRGREVLTEIVQVLSNQSCLITPDGPRGPAFVPKPGVLVSAQRAGVDLVAFKIVRSKTFRFRTWDSLMVPFPFSRVEIRSKHMLIDIVDQRVSNSSFQRLQNFLERGIVGD